MEKGEHKRLEAEIEGFGDDRQQRQLDQSFERQISRLGLITKDQLSDLFSKQSSASGFLSKDQILEQIENYCMKKGFISEKQSIEAIGEKIGVKLDDMSECRELQDDNRWTRKTRKQLEKLIWWVLLGVGGFLANYAIGQHWK